MNNGPKNFKEMIFPPSRDGQYAVYAPLPPAPKPRTITVTEAQKRAVQLEEMKSFVNTQRCPACDAQLDGGIAYNQATLYCCANGEREYKVNFKYGLPHPHRSVTTYYTTHFAFEIENLHIEDNLFKNTIYKIDLSLNKKFQQSQKKTLFSYEGARLVLKKNISEEDLLSKIDLYVLFS